jgi:hypothetical protein
MSGAAGNGMGTTFTGSGLGTKIKYLRRTATGAASSGLGTIIKYL